MIAELAATMTAAAILAACASGGGFGSAGSSATNGPGGGASGAAATAAPSGPPAALLPERKYLKDWFAGTPVAIDFDRSQALVVDVPATFAFGPGLLAPKPALAKVLDHVAVSLRRVPNARVSIAAPADGAATDLGDKRAKAVGDYLVARGVNITRLGELSGTPAGSGVQLRIVMMDPAKAP